MNIRTAQEQWHTDQYYPAEQKRTVTEAEMLDALYEEAVTFAARVDRGEAELSTTRVTIAPPDPLPRRDGSVPLKVVTG